jgi:hypothetical protein
VPTYFYSLNGRASSGFSDLVVSIKRELPVPFGFHLSATGGLGFPTGASKISSHGYDPYIQFPWSRRLNEDWSLHGMFTVTWFTGQHAINPTFERHCRLKGTWDRRATCSWSTSATIPTTRGLVRSSTAAVLGESQDFSNSIFTSVSD